MIKVKDRCGELVEKHNELHAQFMEGSGYLEEGMIKTTKLESENKVLQEESENFRKMLRLHDQILRIEDM